MIRAFHSIAAGFVAVALVSSCSAGDTGDSKSQVTPTTKQIAVPAPPPTSQVNNGSRGAVTFDPCVEFDDPTIENAGYDTESRQRSDSIHDWYAFLGCHFTKMEATGIPDGETIVRTVDISATNISLEEFRERYTGKYHEESIGGRPAIRYSPPLQCGMAIEFPDFVLDIIASAGLTGEKPCDNIITAATVLEASATQTIGGR